MAINNGALDPTEKLFLMEREINGTASGSSLILAVVPFAARVAGAYQSVLGISGTPTHTLSVTRFVTGAGQTNIGNIGAALTCVAYGTSGLQGYSLTRGFTVAAGDLIVLTPGGADSAVGKASLNIVLQALNEYKSYPFTP
jgi:hypothetical protein